MTSIFNDPDNFAKEALAGFCKVYSDRVLPVRGGLIRRYVEESPKVSLVVGGGSGHFPAFAGFVGPGLVDGAVAGDVFASPSAVSVVSVCRAADRGRGVLLGFGNYAGDVLNFGAAVDRLRIEGHDVRILLVTDDLASGDRGKGDRRGVAGDLAVFKIAGAAAHDGMGLDEVEAVAKLANENTVSIGIAFAGCTLPGNAHPLFSISSGTFALGLGIHGEPGISEQKIIPSKELAKMLVGRLMKECPADVTRIAPLLNGLGGTKYEELFLLWSDIEEELAKHGVTPVQPLVGEFVTSLDMSGCSLTLMWLTERLEALWTAPCDSYVLHQGVIAERSLIERHPTIESETAAVNHATPESRKSGNCIAQILASIAKMLKSNEVFLGQLDAVAGDGDHGTGMARGSAAALTAAGLARRNHAGAASVLAAAGDAWADRAGGTSGAIWGILLHSWSTAFSDNASVQDQDIVRGARLSLNRVMRLGGAGKGDKTLVDAFIAFVETLENAFNHGQKITKAWSDACDEAQRAAEQTSTLSPKRGRARPLAHKSVGHPDPGAISFSLCAKEVGRHLRVMT